MVSSSDSGWSASSQSSAPETRRWGEGGTVRFRVTDVEACCGPGVSILVGGEEAGGSFTYGCRMGICHTCVGRLRSGRLRDLRTGDVHGEQGDMVRICVNAPEGHVEVDL
jgi:stearoyl-CoA 9-desaturase NADPH oxidoreductase